MIEQMNLAGSFTLPGTSMTLNRVGYGAMQLAGRDGSKLVWGPPRNVDEAIAVLQEAVANGVNHIDTADCYGPHITNQIIRRALSPYPADLVIVTKVSARRGEDGSWIPAFSRVAASLGATPMQVALAWLLHRSPNILLIPGTSSRKHLWENLQAAQLQIPSEVLANLNSIGKPEKES
jgi:aryl-alcohol dehydrogenase-like predicted oxidoreductase